MARTKTLWLTGAATGVVFAAAWMLTASSRASSATSPKPPGAPPNILAPGLVEAAGERVELAFETSGRVVEVRVCEGEHVVAGQLLARLDDRLARARVERAAAALASAEARRDLMEHGAQPEEISAARAEAEAARAQAAERQHARARAGQLAAQAVISPAQLDADASFADVAAATAAAADARYRLAQKGPRNELKREAIAAVAAARAELMEARVLCAQTELRSPRDGVVLRRFIEPGEQVTSMPLTTALTVADLSHLQVRAEVDESDVGRVAIGQRGWATADGYGARRFAGRVLRLTSELGRKKVRTDDPRARLDTRVLEVIFALDDPVQLPLGLPMNVHLAEGRR
jgi:multidrug resistance efflux pump